MTRKNRTLRASWKLPRYKKEWRSICAMLPKYLQNVTNGTVGYIVLQYVQAVQRVEDDTLVHLEQDNTIVVLDSARTLKRNLALASALLAKIK